MKKRLASQKFVERNRRRSIDRERRRAAHVEWRRKVNASRLGLSITQYKERVREKSPKENYLVINAPTSFSFIRESEGAIDFIRKIERAFSAQKKVWVSLENVKDIDYSAISVLLSIMLKFKTADLDFNGDFPKKETVTSRIMGSGFFENLYKDNAAINQDHHKYSIEGRNGIYTHGDKQVDSILGANLIDSASTFLWGHPRRCQGVQRTFIELMQNTNNHADIETPGAKHWWLTMNQDKSNKKVSFSFVDYGVGIFENLHSKGTASKWLNWPAKMASKLDKGDNAELLESILSGVMHKTVTKKHYRGKGLPGVAEACRRNQISNLFIISNDVFCDYKHDIYNRLNSSFSGTFIYWELESNNVSSPKQSFETI